MADEIIPAAPAPEAQAAPAPEVTPEVTPAVVEPAAPAVPAFDWADESTQTRAAEALKHLETWGSPDDVNQALEIRKALQTEDGVTSLFLEAARYLGISPEKLDSLLATPAATEVATVEEEDPDRVLTHKDAMELVERKLAAAQSDAQREREEATRVETARSTVSAVLAELGVTDQAEVDAVLTAGQRHLADGDFDPEHIKAAVRKGFTEYEAVAKKRAEAYLGKKITDAQTLPGSIGAPTPGGLDLPEPQNMEEAKARARARLRGGQ